MSQDWHNETNDVHFAKYGKHCIAGTWGAEFQAWLKTEGRIVLRKGQKDDEDGFSAWEAYDQDGKSLRDYLKPPVGERRAVILTGVATDLCVDETGERGLADAAVWRNEGRVLDFYIPTDAVRGLHDEDAAAALVRMQKMGAILCDSEQILRGELFDIKPGA